MIERTTYYTNLFSDVQLAADNLDSLIDSLTKGNIIYVAISKLMIKDTYHSSSVCSLTFIFPSKFERSIAPVECKTDSVHETLTQWLLYTIIN